MRVEKSWGYEEVLVNDQYCCKLLVYTRPIASSLHYHEKKHETFVVLSGHFLLNDGGHKREIGPGDHCVLPPGRYHKIRCRIPGTIVEASTHDDPTDCVRLIPSEP